MDLRSNPPTSLSSHNFPARVDGSPRPDADGATHTKRADGVGAVRGVGGVRVDDELALLDEHALRRLLATQPVIEQAKGLLMGYYRVDADRAFAVLRRWSSSHQVKVRDLAERLVEVAARPGPDPLEPPKALTDILLDTTSDTTTDDSTGRGEAQTHRV